MKQFPIGTKLIHKPTGRPVELVAMDETTFTVHTLDDIWPHPKTGKPCGGCKWVMEIDSLEQFNKTMPQAKP